MDRRSALALLLIGFLGLQTRQLRTAEPADADLLAALRAGGHTILICHGRAVAGARLDAVEQLPGAFRDCTGAVRPLNERGLADMRTVGAAFAALGMVVGEALSSPACRCIETVSYIAGRAEIVDDLAGVLGADEDIQAPRLAALRRHLATPPAAGTNRQISTHGSNIGGATGFSLAQGEATIIRPDGSRARPQLVGAWRMVTPRRL